MKKNLNNKTMQESKMFSLMYIAIAIKETIFSQANCYIQTKSFRILHWYLSVMLWLILHLIM